MSISNVTFIDLEGSAAKSEEFTFNVDCDLNKYDTEVITIYTYEIVCFGV